VRHTKVSETLNLVQKTVPIGVLMVIFESRPDALPQVASLAISSANGLLLKGGKEAINTNNFLMGIVKEALGQYGCADSIAMVTTRPDILTFNHTQVDRYFFSKYPEYVKVKLPDQTKKSFQHINDCIFDPQSKILKCVYVKTF
jgi:hypothetical protein